MAQRANWTAQRAAGVLFPKSAAGKRSSTDVGKRIFAEAVRHTDQQAAEAVRAERNWRHRYPAHLVQHEMLAARDPAVPTSIAAAGLEAVHRVFEFAREDTVLPLGEAMDKLRESRLHTATVRGKSQFAGPHLQVPYRGERLAGDRLHRQLDRWCKEGIIEPSHADAIRTVMRNGEWLDLSDRTFILLGAGAEIGPLRFLATHRANIVAVDIPDPQVWTRILGLVAESPCVLHLPTREPGATDLSERDIAQRAGADLLCETPELGAWLESFDSPAAVGCYAYLDGKDHVRLAAAMDALVQQLHAKGSPAAFACLATATDALAVPDEAARCARERYDARRVAKLWQTPARWMSGGRLYAQNIRDSVTSTTGQRYGIYDGLITRQGPNYALAKRIQRWRALTARRAGHLASVNVAPPSLTGSVTSNRAFRAAYAGARHYGAEIFAPETTNALMGALLVHDLYCESSVANPDTPLANPLELFMTGANHGGLWRSPLQIRSVLEIAAVRGSLSRTSGSRRRSASHPKLLRAR